MTAGCDDPNFDTNATTMNRNMVLHNQVLFGTVNAGGRHWEQAAEALAVADSCWLRGTDHTPGAAHFLDKGARPAARRHQGRSGPDRMTPDAKA